MSNDLRLKIVNVTQLEAKFSWVSKY